MFVNVSKGEVAKSQDLQKAFNTTDRDTIVKEVRAVDGSFDTYVILMLDLLGLLRSYRRVKCRLEIRSANMISHPSGEK